MPIDSKYVFTRATLC